MPLRTSSSELETLLGKYENEPLCLIDADATYFKSVATEKLPRTYLLDQEGKILWFDIEYSQSTYRELLKTLDVLTAGS